MAEQKDWRYCKQCHGMFWNGGTDKGKCPGGGGHVPDWMNFSIPHSVAPAPNAQSDWRYCGQCRVMFWGGNGAGVCPSGGHQATGFVFALTHGTAGSTTAQSGWRHCGKCRGLFFEAYGSKGKCPKGEGHNPEGFVFTLPIATEAAAAGPPAVGNWMGVPLVALPSLAMKEFLDAFKAGMAGQIPDDWVASLDAKIRADLNGFQYGYAKGLLTGLYAGLKSLVSTVIDLFQLAISLTPPVLAFRASCEVYYLITDKAHVELRKQQVATARRVVAAASAALEDVAKNPNDYVDLSRDMGEALGKSAGLWFKKDFLDTSAAAIGEAAGNVVGQIAFEIILQVVIELTTAGIGNAARGAVAAGEGARGGSKVASLVERFKPLLNKTKGLRKLLLAFWRDERGALMIGGARRPIPKGLLSRGHAPPGGMRMADPFAEGALRAAGKSGPVEEAAVTARAGVSESSKANPARSMRTGIDASSAEFETFKEAVHVRGEIGIQSSGHANAPGVDFVTAARRADGQVEVILNDATVNQAKKVKTTPPAKWIDEAKAAADPSRLDIGDPILEQEIRDAFNATPPRVRVRTLTVTTTGTGVTVVGW